MSYNIEQFKRTSFPVANYQTKIEVTENMVTDNLIKYNFKANTIYYLKGTVKSKNSTGSKKFRIKLNDSKNENKYQIIDMYNYSSIGGTLIEIFFIPKYDFEQIILEDMDNKNEIFTMATLTTFNTITNLIGNNETKIPFPVKQIGVQGPQGLTFIINGEKIVMGKSGIYMSSEMEITSIGFCIETKQSAQLGQKDPDNPIGEGYDLMYPDNYTFFIMDYKY